VSGAGVCTPMARYCCCSQASTLGASVACGSCQLHGDCICDVRMAATAATCCAMKVHARGSVFAAALSLFFLARCVEDCPCPFRAFDLLGCAMGCGHIPACLCSKHIEHLRAILLVAGLELEYVMTLTAARCGKFRPVRFRTIATPSSVVMMIWRCPFCLDLVDSFRFL
jgi:hypothetical protein